MSGEEAWLILSGDSLCEMELACGIPMACFLPVKLSSGLNGAGRKFGCCGTRVCTRPLNVCELNLSLSDGLDLCEVGMACIIGARILQDDE